MMRRSWRMPMTIVRITATAIIVASCSIEHVKVAPLPLPVKPVLPEVPGQDLQCLMPTTYDMLVKRDRLLHAYAKELEAVVCTTRPKPCP